MDANVNYFESNFVFIDNHKLFNLNFSSFVFFFNKYNMIIPKTLTKIPSLRRLEGSNSLNVFIRYLTRHGLKNFSVKLILIFIFKFLRLYGFSYNKVDNYNYTKLLLCFINPSLNSLTCNVKQSISNLKSLFSTSFNSINLIFTFFIYKVDKHIYKNSRGRSGKFTFIWKYLTPYKRHMRICYWLLKEVRINAGKTLNERIFSVIHNFLINPNNSLIWKIKKFSLNYTYYNLRNSLLETYKTTPK